MRCFNGIDLQNHSLISLDPAGKGIGTSKYSLEPHLSEVNAVLFFHTKFQFCRINGVAVYR